MKARTRKAAAVAMQRAWLRNPIRRGVLAGWYRNAAAPWRGPHYQPFFIVVPPTFSFSQAGDPLVW